MFDMSLKVIFCTNNPLNQTVLQSDVSSVSSPSDEILKIFRNWILGILLIDEDQSLCAGLAKYLFKLSTQVK